MGKIKTIVENEKIPYKVAWAEEDSLLVTGDQIRYNQYLEQAIFCLYDTDSWVQSTIGTKQGSITNNGQGSITNNGQSEHTCCLLF